MYCIISLPRTASTYAWHLINQPLTFQNPEYSKIGKFSAFNPRSYNKEEVESRYEQIINSSPLPLIKIISSHDFDMVDRIIASNYKTIFIYPEDLRKQILKVLVAKKTDSFVDKRVRKKYVGSLVITKEEIIQRLEHYKEHMRFQYRCDYQFSNRYILSHPQEFVTSLGLEYMGTRFKYEPYEISDEEMLQNVNDFYELYDECLQQYNFI